jgi:hypothetical protein
VPAPKSIDTIIADTIKYCFILILPLKKFLLLNEKDGFRLWGDEKYHLPIDNNR